MKRRVALRVAVILMALCGSEVLAESAVGPIQWERHLIEEQAWKPRWHFVIGDRLYWIRLSRTRLSVSSVISGRVEERAAAFSFLEAAKIWEVASDRAKALFIVMSKREEVEVFRYDVADHRIELWWKGQLTDLIIDVHYLDTLDWLVITGQNKCYAIESGVSVFEIGPITHVAEWFFTASAATSSSLALNLERGLTVYTSKGKSPLRLLEADEYGYIREMASVGDEWIVTRAAYVGTETKAMRVGLLSDGVSVEPIALKAQLRWRVSDYGDVVILWADGGTEMLFVRRDALSRVTLPEPLDTLGVSKGYSTEKVFLIDSNGYRVATMPLGTEENR